MFQNNYPKFAQGVVLKAAMLENMSLYQRNMIGMIYSGYSDGILKGANPVIENGTTIVISPGIIKHKGMLYHMYNETRIDAQPSHDTQYLRIRFSEMVEKSDEIHFESEVILDENVPDATNETEICRFVLNNGAVLRNSYRDLKDYSTLHDTVNIIETMYSAEGRATFSPDFLKAFGREMLKYRLLDMYDIYFANECLKGEHINREIIERYLSTRLEMPYKSLSNQEIYKNLLRIADMARKGEGSAAGRSVMQARRMLVD